MKISFSPPDITEAEIQEVCDALRSGWITTGPRTKEFERQIAQMCGTNKAVCLNSATAALELSLRVLGIGPGDEVIVPAYTYTASASVICHVGAKPVLVDCAAGQYEMDYDRLPQFMNEHTKAVLGVDLAGMVCDYDKIYDVVDANKHLFNPANDIQKHLGRMAVLADSAHAFGAMRNGKMTGSIADFTSFSFHAVKNLTTAEGGALTWNENISSMPGADESLYKLLQLYSLHGQNKDALAKTQAGGWEYDIVGPYYKCNMTDIMAAIGLAQLKRYPGMLRRRQQMVEMYNERFKDCPIEHLVHASDNYISSFHLYLTRLIGRDSKFRNEVIVKMAERGITCNVHFKPLPMMTAYKALGYDIKDFPNAYNQFANEVTLPLHTLLTDEQVEYIADNYIDIIK